MTHADSSGFTDVFLARMLAFSTRSSTMTVLTLPPPIAAYFMADKNGPDAVARCFTEHATVKDERRTHAGIEAIKAWKTATSAQYTYTTTPVELAEHPDSLVVTSRVAGSFPGSPIDLRYRFQLEGGLIASLEITA
jgi:hypothetical protein